MKLSRILGAAITCGTLFGSGLAHAQVNYGTAFGLAPSHSPPNSLARVPVGNLPAYPTAAYPITGYPTTTYPTTGERGYSVASLPSSGSGTMQFAGPSNATVTRLPASTMDSTPRTPASLISHSPYPSTSESHLPAVGESVLTSPSVPSGMPENVGPIGSAPSGITPFTTAPLAGPACATGSGAGLGAYSFQPFGGKEDCATGTGCYVGPSRWYGGMYGMVLTRDAQEHFTFSYDTGNEAIQYTDQKDAGTGWGGGFATVVGHYFNCGQNAIEGVYWGWFPGRGSTYTYGANAIVNINGIHNWSSLTYNGLNMDSFVDGAQVHALFHDSEAHNVELNFLSFSSGFGCGTGKMRYTLLAGVRYFHFRDHLTFQSDPNDTAFTGEVDEIYYDIKTINDLVGMQIGGVGTYCVGPRLSLNAGTKVGLYGNSIGHRSVIGGPAGVAVINNGPNINQAFYVDNSKTDVSFLTELFLGCGYCVNSHLSLSAGYRAIAVTGLAMPSDQIYPDLRGINDLATIESPSSMILHGAWFGGQFVF